MARPVTRTEVSKANKTPAPAADVRPALARLVRPVVLATLIDNSLPVWAVAGDRPLSLPGSLWIVPLIRVASCETCFQPGQGTTLVFVESRVGTVAGLSSAQRQVLTAVKRRGEASADEVAGMLGITPSAVRQHLAILRTGGFVASRQERGRPGRPADVYHSTELGESLFAAPATGEFSVELLRHIEDEAPELIPRLFERRRRGRVEQYRDQLAGQTLGDAVSGLAGILDAEGYMADVDRLPDDNYRLTLHSCAIWAVASQYGLACTTELEFLQQVIPSADITRVIHKVAGAFVCAYDIRAANIHSSKPRPTAAGQSRRS
jgi:DeoR family transcriptional regulator, suf operon transcriptional repressor